jgi:hypothetical protein
MILRQPGEVESAKQARRSIGLIRRKLLNPTPQVLDSCSPHLRNAIQCMEHLLRLLESSPEGASWRSSLQAEVLELSRELSQANALLRGAANYYFGLASFLLPPPEENFGYSSAGAMAATPAPSLVLEG